MSVVPQSTFRMTQAQRKLATAAARAAVNFAVGNAPAGRTKTFQRRGLRGAVGNPPTTVAVATTGRRVPRLGTGKTLNSKVNKLIQKVKAGEATHTHRFQQAVELQVGTVNQAKYIDLAGMKTSSVEDALATLRYYDPSNPATLVTADGDTGTYSRQFYIDNASTGIQVKNNYQIGADVRIYSCTPREDTSIDPDSAFQSGMTDQGNPSIVSTQLFPNDSEQFRKLWKIEKVTSKILQPGQSLFASHSIKPFSYDPSNVDTHNLSFQKQYGGQAWLVRLHGVLGHATTGSTFGLCVAGVDIIYKRKLRITYDAGTSLEDYSVSELTMGACTVESQKPLADNIAYSLP